MSRRNKAQQQQKQAQEAYQLPQPDAQQPTPMEHWEVRESVHASGPVPAVGNSAFNLLPRPSTTFARSSKARSSRIHPSVPDLTGQIRLQHWRPSSYGGQADVYIAFWNSPDGVVNVAVKAVRMLDDPDGRILRRFQREISVWRKLAHPHVQPLFGLCSDMGPLPAMISQWHSNGDIVRYVKSMSLGDPWFLVDTKHRLLTEVLEGLTYLHSEGVIHGDLKGANVLIDDDGSARLCDFGLAAALTESSVTFTQHTLKGTCRWMAPELLVDDDAQHTKATDVWAFGGVCIEVLGGVPPYHTKKNDQQVILALSRQELPERPVFMDADGMNWGLIEGCYGRHPGDRPAAEVILAEMRVYRMFDLPTFRRSDTEAIRGAGVEALRALVQRTSAPGVGLHSYTLRLISWYCERLEHNPSIGADARGIVDSLWTMLFICIRHAETGHAQSCVEPTASVALRAIQAFGPPFTPPRALRSRNLQPLYNVLPPDSAAILHRLACSPYLDQYFPAPLKAVPSDIKFAPRTSLDLTDPYFYSLPDDPVVRSDTPAMDYSYDDRDVDNW